MNSNQTTDGKFEEFLSAILKRLEFEFDSGASKERKNFFYDVAKNGISTNDLIVKYGEFESERLRDFSGQFEEKIEKEANAHPSKFRNQDFRIISLEFERVLYRLFLKSSQFIKDRAKADSVPRQKMEQSLNQLQFAFSDCKNHLRLKLDELGLSLSLSIGSGFSYDEVDELNKLKEIIQIWDYCRNKDLLIKQIDDFFSSDLTVGNLTVIYRATIPEIETIMRNIAEGRGIEGRIGSLGDGIRVLSDHHHLLKNETLALLGLIHEPYRNIAEHGLELPVLVLKMLCLSAFEVIRFLYNDNGN
jgi:hypothetical protein